MTIMMDEAPSQDHRRGVPANFFKGGRHNWHQKRRHRAFLGFVRRLRGEVLDYGCGYGDLSHAISRTHPVRGVDVDPARVAFAAREYAPITFEACRPDGLDFPDGSFDVVASSVVLPFVPDPAAYVRECHRVLRVGGHLVLATKNVPHVRNALRRLSGRQPIASRLWARPRGEVRALLERLGFRIIDETYFYDPPFDGWNNLRTTFHGLIEQALSLCRVAETSGYFVFLALKSPGDDGPHGA